MGKTYLPYDPDQLLLLPPSLRDWLPEGHLAYFISDAVDQLEMVSIYAVYEKEARGQLPYHPQMLVKILLYGYCKGVASSRKIAKACEEDIGFRILAAGNHPDFRTISDFRKRHLKALAGLFVEVLRLCQNAGLVKLGHVALDGTKMKANASKHKAMSYGRILKREEELKKEVDELLRRAQSVDNQEDQQYGKDIRGDELPKELAFRATRLKRLREAKAALEERAKAEMLEKAEKANQKKKAMQGVAVKKTPQDVTPETPMVCNAVEVREKSQYNFTDPQSRIMLSGTKSFEQAYNCQAVVDATAQVIVACDVTQAANDKEQLEPMMMRVKENLGFLPDQASADTGYWSEDKIEALAKTGIDLFIPPEKLPKRRNILMLPTLVTTDEPMTSKEKMRAKLSTPEGRSIYSKRKETVEPGFGQIKQARGFRQFSFRGKEKVKDEWSLICLTHNLLKLWRHERKTSLKAQKDKTKTQKISLN